MSSAWQTAVGAWAGPGWLACAQLAVVGDQHMGPGPALGLERPLGLGPGSIIAQVACDPPVLQISSVGHECAVRETTRGGSLPVSGVRCSFRQVV